MSKEFEQEMATGVQHREYFSTVSSVSDVAWEVAELELYLKDGTAPNDAPVVVWRLVLPQESKEWSLYRRASNLFPS